MSKIPEWGKEWLAEDMPEDTAPGAREFWQEQVRLDAWIEEGEAGKQGASVAITGEYATVKEVAARHRLAEKTIRKRIHDGELRVVAHPADAPPKQQRYRIHRDDEIAWIEAKREKMRASSRRTPTTTKAARSFKDLVKK